MRKFFSKLVRLARFERATYCLGGSCSILLSYNRDYNLELRMQNEELFFCRLSFITFFDNFFGEFVGHRRIIRKLQAV